MSNSPVQFARAFEKFCRSRAAASSEDNALRLLLRFWTELKPVVDNPTYSTYADEFRGYLNASLDTGANAIVDFDLADCGRLANMCRVLNADECAETAVVEQARRLSWLGESEKAVRLLTEYFGEPSNDRVEGGFEEQDELKRLEMIAASITDVPRTSSVLNAILRDWHADRDSLSHERVQCLFVESSYSGPAQGRMRSLKAAVELFGKTARTDEITFDNQIKSPSDPFVGVCYDSLKAVRRLLIDSSGRREGKAAYHCHFTIENSDHTFTGNSIGLAAALVTYTQLLYPQVLRHERFLSGEVGVTGSIDESGTLLPINYGTLEAKIRRAFCSPVKWLVLPPANLEKAQDILDQLRSEHPRRHLRLIGASHLRDVVDDLNVVRAEKVCIGQFVARRAFKYSRATRIQVPLLLGLIWLLMALLWPKQFDPWFDWKIDRVEISGNRFRTVNASGQTIWWSKRYESFNRASFLREFERADKEYYFAFDVDKNGKEELWLVSPAASEQGQLKFFDDNGDVLWERPIFIETTYLGDVDAAGYQKNLKYGLRDFLPIMMEDSAQRV